MVFKILDASAFYAGIPFTSQNEFYTTSKIYDEIKHIKNNHDALGILLETKRLKIIDPEKKFSDQIIKKSKSTGDHNVLSSEDISTLALALQLNGEIITDDFAISNVAKSIGLKVSPLMTSGIKNKGKWVHYCAGCHMNFADLFECPNCGNPLRKKLLKDNSGLDYNWS